MRTLWEVYQDSLEELKCQYCESVENIYSLNDDEVICYECLHSKGEGE